MTHGALFAAVQGGAGDEHFMLLECRWLLTRCEERA